MLVDGKKIAAEIAEGLEERDITLLVLRVGHDPASASFIRVKRSFAEKVGIKMIIEHLPEKVTNKELLTRIDKANKDKGVNGVIVQLPLPEHIDAKQVLHSINPNKDPDALSVNPLVLPPVVAAIEEIVRRYNVDLYFADVAVVGYGQLVGQPVTKWLREAGVEFALITTENKNPEKILRNADVIISGVGKPWLIKLKMIKEGCAIIDAGTSESGGVLKGDVDPACASKCSLFTPVPGGLGPIAVAMLFRNLLALNDRNR